MKNLMRRVAHSGMWSTIQTFGNNIFQLITFLFLSRLLGPENIGIVAIADILVELLIVFVRFGLPETIIQQTNLTDRKTNTAFWTVTCLGVFSALFAVSISGYLARLFAFPSLESVVTALAVVPLIASLSIIHEARLMRKFGFKTLAFCALIYNLISGVIGISMAFYGFGIWSLVAQRIIATLILTIWTWRAFPWKPGFGFSFEELRVMTRFGRNILVTALLSRINNRMVEIILGLFFNAATVGYYRVTWRCLDFMIRMTSIPLASIALPTFSRLKNNATDFKFVFLKMLQVFSIVSFPLFIGSIVVAPDLIQSLFGSEWRLSGELLQIFCIAGIPLSFMKFVWPTLASLGHANWVARTNIGLVVFGGVFVVASAPFGVIAVAWANVLRTLLAIPVVFILLNRAAKIGFPSIFQTTKVPAVGALVMFSLLVNVREYMTFEIDSILNVIVVVLLGIFIYAAILMVCFKSSLPAVRQLLRTQKSMRTQSGS